MKRIAVLISNKGEGTNLQAIIDGVKSGKINGEIALVVSDSENAYGLARARNANIPTLVISKEDNLEQILKDHKIDYICLGGWKQIIPDSLIDVFPKRILNIHPGLIPDTPDGVVKNPDGTDGLWNKGKFTEKAIQNFLDSKVTYAGSTVHLLSREFDFGSALERVFIKIEPGDTVMSLYQRLKVKENEAYVKALERICNE